MSSTVVGIFDRMMIAEDAIQELQNAGIPRNEISLVAQGNCRTAGGETATHVAGAGAAGAAIGGVAGLLLGLVGFALPGIGPVLAAGPIAAAFTAGGIGAAAGGILGALRGMSIPENEARYYADAVRGGCALLLVKARSRVEAERARQVLNRSAAAEETPSTGPPSAVEAESARYSSDIEAVHLRAAARPGVPHISLTGARIYDIESLRDALRNGLFDDFEAEWRRGFSATFQELGYRYEQFKPAYRYGHVLAADQRQESRGWAEIESAVRDDWEYRNPDTWDQVKDAIRYAFEGARARQVTAK